MFHVQVYTNRHYLYLYPNFTESGGDDQIGHLHDPWCGSHVGSNDYRVQGHRLTGLEVGMTRERSPSVLSGRARVRHSSF